MPFSGSVDGQVESGIIDALFQKNGDWIIAEFKADEVNNEAEFKKLLEDQDYLLRVQGYAEVAKRLLGVEPRVVICMSSVCRIMLMGSI